MSVAPGVKLVSMEFRRHPGWISIAVPMIAIGSAMFSGTRVALDRLRRLILPPILTLGLVPYATDAQDAPTGELALEDVVRLTLLHNPSIAAATNQALERRGDTKTAAGAFDLQLRTFFSRENERVLGDDGLAEPSADPSTTTSRITYGAGASRRFRSGFVFTQDVGVVRTAHPSFVDPPNVSTARLSLTTPLLRDRGTRGFAVTRERSAAITEQAARFRTRAVASVASRDAAYWYWRYVSIYSEVESLRRAEDRARRLMEETRRLVEMDERPASDLAQLQANLAYRESVRIEADQRLIEYRYYLGSAIGLPADETGSLPRPANVFPDVVIAPQNRDSVVWALTELAATERGDLAAARHLRQAAEIRVSGAQGDRRPRLDMTLRLGYSGVERGNQWGHLITPLYRNVEGLSSAVEVSYQWTARNRLAQGFEAQARAQLRQRTVEEANLEQTIRASVRTMVDVLILTAAEVERAATSLTLYRQVVETERTKYRMGMATLFDVIHAEEALTRAELVHLATRERHAVTLLLLREETGTLVTAGPDLELTVPPQGASGMP